MWSMILLHVFREVVPCLRAGDRKSTATNSYQLNIATKAIETKT